MTSPQANAVGVAHIAFTRARNSMLEFIDKVHALPDDTPDEVFDNAEYQLAIMRTSQHVAAQNLLDCMLELDGIVGECAEGDEQCDALVLLAVVGITHLRAYNEDVAADIQDEYDGELPDRPENFPLH